MHRTDSKKLSDGFCHAGFFVLRAPLLPFEELLAWGEGLSAWRCWNRGELVDAKKAWEEDVEVLRARLRDIASRPEIVHALFLASPSLHLGLKHWVIDPDSKKGLQAERALVRYFSRMSARPTPFGIFSGCSVGRVDVESSGAATILVLQSRDRSRPKCRLDFDYLFALTSRLRSQADLAGELSYRPNSSLHKIGEAWHYVESRLDGKHRAYNLVEIESNVHLQAVLDRAQLGARISELTEALLAVPDELELSEDEAVEYVLEVIQNQVLVSDLTPLVTGPPPLDDIIYQLESAQSGRGAAQILRDVRCQMAELDRKGVGVSPSEYTAIASKVSSLSATIDTETLFQVDMIRPVQDARLGIAIIDELVRGVGVMCRLSQPSESEPLRKFCDAFVARYERQSVPLLDALDEENGIGFPDSTQDISPVIRGLALGASGIGSSVRESDISSALLRKLMASVPEGTQELCLDPADLPNEVVPSSVPDSFALTVTLAGASPAAIEAGEFDLVLHGGAAPNGARLLGRFCHADSELEQHVRRYVEQEDACDPEAIYAEIVYLPEGRVGNVLCRPVLRHFEIVYLGRSGAPLERQLPVSDLLVSVEGRRVVLHSKRLGKRVIPRLTNAHGFMNPKLPPVYRFLCLLQDQNGTVVPNFSWGTLAEALDFLPRVRTGRVVLAQARWRISKKEIDDVGLQHREHRFAAVQRLRQTRGLPRWVLFEEFDNALPVDLDNPLSVDAFVHVLKRVQRASLREMYPPHDQLGVSSPEGHFYHELSVPFMRRVPANGERVFAGRPTPPTVCRGVRTFAPGSEWLYVKLYCGVATRDEVLTRVLPDLIRSATESNIITRWFFVRYGDPQQHLRIRFLGLPGRLQSDLLPLLYRSINPLLTAGRIWKVQLDTYERELERYGGADGIVAAEEIFWADSEAVQEILKAVDGEASLSLRWPAAIPGVDSLLTDLGFDLQGKRTLLETMCKHQQREFQPNSVVKKQLGDRFRAERRMLKAVWEGKSDEFWVAGVAREAFARRSTRIADSVRRLHALRESEELAIGLSDLALSYVHMHFNRLFRSSARVHEFVLSDFLFRLYDGQVVRDLQGCDG